MSRATRTVLIDAAVLRRLPLPVPEADDDKEGRGRVLVVGGSSEMPGALILSGTAALRAGAGKVRLATVGSVAASVACAVPEARVYALPETRKGGIGAAAAERLAELAREADAVCVGQGMLDRAATNRLLEALLPRLGRAALVLDADALACLSENRRLLHALHGGAIITPNADEVGEVFGTDPRGQEDGAAVARRLAGELRAAVVLKGRETFVASDDGGRVYVNRAGNVGLATSGTGDVLAGLIAGLAARGARNVAAAAWGVHAHALAGERLARRVAPVGYLARELLEELPSVLNALTKSSS